jgi:hypothetical protein
MLSLFLPVITFSKNARSARFSEAGAIVRSSLPCFPRKLPCFRPNNRETGSYMTACTTIQSAQTAGDNTIRKKGLFAGIFDVVLIAISSLRIVIASPQPILMTRLCSRKFRSWRLSSERKKGRWLVGNQAFGARSYCVLSPSASNWPLHCGGGSRSRSTPIPRGRRPSTAARTRSGARNASEMVMLTWRTLHF